MKNVVKFTAKVSKENVKPRAKKVVQGLLPVWKITGHQGRLAKSYQDNLTQVFKEKRGGPEGIKSPAMIAVLENL